MTGDLVGSRWDEEYRRGRYAAEPPVPFVETILSVLTQHGLMRDAVGLYVGCGNGRNYLPLVDAQANVIGLDISEEAIKRLSERRPDRRLPLVTGDFRAFQTATQFGYVIAIQVFQHGMEHDVAVYFDKVARLLAPGGLFCLAVHFYSSDELMDLTKADFEILAGPRQDITPRALPKTGAWAQWEVVWRKRARDII